MSINNNDFKNEKELHACCFEKSTDKALLILCFQFVLSVTLVGFSIYGIIEECSKQSDTSFETILTAVLAFWFGKVR